MTTFKARMTMLATMSLYVLTPLACSKASPQNGVATPKDIATDLPDDGSSDKPIELYWVTDDQIFRGRCATRDVMLRSQCTSDIQSMPYATFKKQLDGGLSDTIQQLQAEATQIQNAIAGVDSQIQDVLAQINQIEQQSGQLSQQLAALKAQMANFETIVQGYQQQLTMINQALQNAVDQDMSQLQSYVVNQLAKYQDQLSGISTSVQNLMQQLAQAQAGLTQLQEQADALNTRLDNLKSDLSGVQTQLQSAYDDFSVYQTTLDYTTGGIVRPILSSNVWWEKERQFVKRFDKIFSTVN